jgi:DedD protein
MRDNTRFGEKFEVALDGRQIASVVVGALVLLGVVFVLGYNVGRQVGGRPDRAPAAGTLAALDEAGQERTTFWDQLPKNRPARPPSGPAPGAPPEAAPARPAPEPAVVAVSAAPATPAPLPADAQPASSAPADGAPPAAALAAASSGAGTPVTASAVTEPPAERPPSPAPAAAPRAERRGSFTVQVGATQSRADADRLAARFTGRGARIAEGEAAGIGRVWRVRVGSFADRAAAARLSEQLARETGVKGFVTQVP